MRYRGRRIVVISRHIEIAEHRGEIGGMIAEAGVCGNKSVRYIRADNVRLKPYEFKHIIGRAAFKVYHIRGVQPGGTVSSVRRIYLLPRLIFAAPHYTAVCLVERSESAVFSFQPFAVLFIAGVTEANIGFKLIVQLPGGDIGKILVMLRKLCDYASGIFAQCGRIIAAMTAYAYRVGPAVVADRKYFRVLLA